MQVRWANLQAIDIKFSHDLTHQKSLKSVNFIGVIGKIKGGGAFFHGQCRACIRMFQIEIWTIKLCIICTNVPVVHGKTTEWTRNKNRILQNNNEARDRKRNCHIRVESVRRSCSLQMPQLKLGAETEKALKTRIFCNSITNQSVIITTTIVLNNNHVLDHRVVNRLQTELESRTIGKPVFQCNENA